MAKVSFTKLGLTKNQEVKNVEWNEQVIEVKQYLPVTEKLELIANVMNAAHDENNFSNPVKVDVYTALEILYSYTNISFTEKQKEDAAKLYDLVRGNGLLEKIIDAIPEDEYYNLKSGIYASIDAVYTYRSSVLGILEAVKEDYSNVSLDATDIQSQLSDPENMALLRGILDRLG